ncbi:hypothetical protein A1O3_07330 [Capronia epimyces CBS 606.96]|uniref:Major facilitator superfamily (MFS) profile domain-containing protein n=1 Tax=Capronia epimyces CBS 606.96 TaxID=1182542 RepID=W9XKJ0_9EURO|nr:uncharacterized protein A1O3_07330 [Capronia epimyces CBS 606.96]EXJ81042.1 hypothetical protein A1O3_07330 [Capronia epimyces CBS 606.96]
MERLERASTENAGQPFSTVKSHSVAAAAPLSDDTDLVDFMGDNDPHHPYNWTRRRKMLTSAVLAVSTFIVALSSALFSAAVGPFAAHFGVSHEVGTLGVSLYVLGFATGPIFWAPFSEIKGRWSPIVLGMAGFSIFGLGVASGKDVQTVLICRFWCGIFGASPMTVVAGVFADMFDGRSRGAATTVFSMTILMGPTMAPFVGGFIVESSLGWRWVGWISSIAGFTSLLLDCILLEETFGPCILQRRAARLRIETGNWALHSAHDCVQLDVRTFLSEYLLRPFRLLFTEPLVFLISLYLAFVYGLVYLFLTAYPMVFQGVHGMSPGVGGLGYLGMVVGIIVGGLYLIVIVQPSYRRKLAANNNIALPEWRLQPAIAGAVSFAVGILWFGWTGYREDIHWILPALSGILTGLGIIVIFQQLGNYLIDVYLPVAASVFAGSAVIRSLCGAGFPLFAKAMFQSLGINYASTVLGGVAVLGIPIPVAFYLRGAALRSKTQMKTCLSDASEEL